MRWPILANIIFGRQKYEIWMIIYKYHVCSGQDGAGPELRNQGRGVGQRGHTQEVHLQTCFGYITH